MKQYFHTITSRNQNRQLAYLEWGNPSNPTVVCVHGLTRNAQDFNNLSEALANNYHVYSFDMAGRGKSDWLENSLDYTYPTYVEDMSEVMKSLGLRNVNFIGTSMGGIIGMMLAAMPNTPIKRLIINDVGPFLPKQAIHRISQYLSFKQAPFEGLRAVEYHLRLIHAPFGPLTDEQWQQMTFNSVIQNEKGAYVLHYDPAIADVFSSIADEDIEFWEVWDAISSPSLILRGENSDILLEQTAQKMVQTSNNSLLVTFEGIGHAPALMSDEQIKIIFDWLNSPA